MGSILMMSLIVLFGVAASLMVMAVAGGRSEIFKSLAVRVIAYCMFQVVRRPLAEGWCEKAIYGIERWWPVPVTVTVIALVIVEESFWINNLLLVFLCNIAVNMNLAVNYYNGLMFQEIKEALAEGEYLWLTILVVFLSIILLFTELMHAIDGDSEREWIIRRE